MGKTATAGGRGDLEQSKESLPSMVPHLIGLLPVALVLIPIFAVVGFVRELERTGALWWAGCAVTLFLLSILLSRKGLKKIAGVGAAASVLLVIATGLVMASVWIAEDRASAHRADLDNLRTLHQRAGAKPSAPFSFMNRQDMQAHAVRFNSIASQELAAIEAGHRGQHGPTFASLICNDIALLALRPLEPGVVQRFGYGSYGLPAPKLDTSGEAGSKSLDALRAVVPQGQVRQNLSACGRILGFSF